MMSKLIKLGHATETLDNKPKIVFEGNDYLEAETALLEVDRAFSWGETRIIKFYTAVDLLYSLAAEYDLDLTDYQTLGDLQNAVEFAMMKGE